jgi:multisubunit Na+/H+ antiporter MnhF subunit
VVKDAESIFIVAVLSVIGLVAYAGTITLGRFLLHVGNVCINGYCY